MKYLIYSDIDGTIYGEDRKIHKDLIKDIEYAKSKDAEFIICTGNPYFKHVKELAQQIKPNFLILSTGAAIYDVENKKYLFEKALDKEVVNNILEIANSKKLATNFWDESKMYMNQYMPKNIVSYWEKTLDDKVIIEDIASSNNIFKIDIWSTPEDIKVIDDVLELIKPFEDKVQIARTEPWHIEVNLNGVSKGSAIEYLNKHLGIEKENTMGIGDSGNDLSMFEVVEHSYAMDNAPQEIKDKAKHYAADVKQNGVGLSIIDFLYRKGIRD